MTFRLFIYYCALCGAWAAFIGWALGRSLAPGGGIARGAVMGLLLGLMLALGVGLVDSIWHLGVRRLGQVFLRVLVGALVGALGGLLGGLLYFWLFNLLGVAGWVLMGLLIGASLGAFEMLASFITRKEVNGARQKIISCMAGGAVGGLFGGVLLWLLQLAFAALLSGKNQQWLWSPTALGFVSLGACIGLFVGFIQVFLRDAWIRVESGVRQGREMILAKDSVLIGKADASDLALAGDIGVERSHAAILKLGNQYFLEDKNSSTGTFLNDQLLRGRQPLRNGDMIRVGNSVLRFFAKQKR